MFTIAELSADKTLREQVLHTLDDLTLCAGGPNYVLEVCKHVLSTAPQSTTVMLWIVPTVSSGQICAAAVVDLNPTAVTLATLCIEALCSKRAGAGLGLFKHIEQYAADNNMAQIVLYPATKSVKLLYQRAYGMHKPEDKYDQWLYKTVGSAGGRTKKRSRTPKSRRPIKK